MDWDELLPGLVEEAGRWAMTESERILRDGSALTAEDAALAQRVGVREPGRVRVLSVSRVPEPRHPGLRTACAALDFLGPDAAGLTLGYGVYLRSSLLPNPGLMAHELRHVEQFERHASLAEYLEAYITQVVRHGYAQAPFEVDARSVAAACVREGIGRPAAEG